MKKEYRKEMKKEYVQLNLQCKTCGTYCASHLVFEYNGADTKWGWECLKCHSSNYEIITKRVDRFYTCNRDCLARAVDPNHPPCRGCCCVGPRGPLGDSAVKALPRRKFDTYTWAEISELADMELAADLFCVGDCKTVSLYTGEVIKVVILGFNHDTISGTDTQEAGITLGLRDMLDGQYKMNEQYTNVGGWHRSEMRNIYMPRFFKLLPADLQAVIKTVDKKTGEGGGSTNLITSQDKLFLFSQKEVTNEEKYTLRGEGKQYPYFKDKDDFGRESGGRANAWWLRSPYGSSISSFCYINSPGKVDNTAAGINYGVSFGFCI